MKKRKAISRYVLQDAIGYQLRPQMWYSIYDHISNSLCDRLYIEWGVT